jgi:MoaA/NifB/PqqE/SkfB family radical SAM enzyme
VSAPRRSGRLAAAAALGRQAFNGAGNMLRRALGRGLEPRRIWFEVTDRCNSRCEHCGIWNRSSTAPPLTPAEIERAFRDPIFRNIEAIINSGGEPTLRDDMEEILEIEHRLFPRASLDYSTNALLPDRAMALVERMAGKKIPLAVGISLDGIGARHDAVRGRPGNFEKADRLLRELARLRDRSGGLISPCIGFTLSPLTIGDYDEVKAYAASIDVPLAVQWLNLTSFYGNEICPAAPGVEERASMLRIVRSLPKGLLNDRWIDWLAGRPIAFPCFAMHTFCVLKANGDIAPCLTHWNAVIGNVREESPGRIWRGAEATKARRLVARCEGCLNSWGVGWSALYAVYPNWLYYLRHRDILVEKMSRFLPFSGDVPRKR